MGIVTTRFERDLPLTDPAYAYLVRRGEGWTLFCKNGPTFMWEPARGEWVISTNVRVAGWPTMDRVAGLEALATVKTVRQSA